MQLICVDPVCWMRASPYDIDQVLADLDRLGQSIPLQGGHMPWHAVGEQEWLILKLKYPDAWIRMPEISPEFQRELRSWLEINGFDQVLAEL